MTMKLHVNDELLEFRGATVAELLEQLEVRGRRLAVEVNQEIVPRGEHAEHTLRDGDVVEIIHAVGGG